MSAPAAAAGPRLSTLRIVSFVPRARDAVHVGLLTPDAQHVVDLAHLGMNDVLDAIAQLDMLRRGAGAIVHGPMRTAHEVSAVHLVASIPLARSVVVVDGTDDVTFAEPATLHGPGSLLSRAHAAGARVGLAAVVGRSMAAAPEVSEAELDDALVGSAVVLGWPQDGPAPHLALRPGAIGPVFAVPRRRPESLIITHVAPVGAPDADGQQMLAAPDESRFFAAARLALRTHALHPGDLITIFPAEPPPADRAGLSAGSWIRASAPGLGTLSLAVQ